MACSSPLYGFRRLCVDKESGEIVPGQYTDISETTYTEDKRYSFMKVCRSPKLAMPGHIETQFSTPEARLHYFEHLSSNPNYETALIPCGSCLECRLEYSRQWANRCMLEASTSQNNWFLTLTYDDEHLPKNKDNLPTLVKKDLQNFNKRLREYFDYHLDHQGIRFFGSGEYGDESARPHYHGIYFNLPITDLRFLKMKKDHALFTSDLLNRLWSVKRLDSNGKTVLDSNGKPIYDPLGFVVITDVCWDSCAYVARYVVKKQKGQGSSIYKELDIVPEFSIMSRKPGLARDYFEQHKDYIYKFDKLVIDGGNVVRPSRYYDKLFNFEDPVLLDELKQRRINLAKTSLEIQLQNTNLSYLDYQKVCHDNLVHKVKSLKRDEI